MSMNSFRRWLFVLPVAIALIVYLPLMRFQFVWDDIVLLTGLSSDATGATWLTLMSGVPLFSAAHSGPVAALAYLIVLRLGDLAPALMRVLNILLHAANTLLVVRLAMPSEASDRKPQTPWVPLVAGLAYALHPALLGSVAPVINLPILLMTCFLLLALFAQDRIATRGRRLATTSAAFLLAVLSHESALLFVVVLPLWHLARQPRSSGSGPKAIDSLKDRGHLLTYGVMLAIGAIYIGIRFARLGYLFAPASAGAGNPIQHALLIVRSLIEYVLLAVWPFGTVTPFHYRVLPISLLDLGAWFSLALLVMLVAGIVALVRKYPVAGWPAAAGLLFLVPMCNLPYLDLAGGAFVSERFLAFPMALWALAVASLLENAWSRATDRPSWSATLATSVPAAWLVASLMTLQLMLPYWHDNLTYWSWAAGRVPGAIYPHLSLAREYISQGRYDTGLAAAEYALSLDPNNADALNAAGVAYLALERYEEAQTAFEKATQSRPSDPLLWTNLSAAYRELGKLEEAEGILVDNALELDPGFSMAYVQLAKVYLAADRPDLASQMLQTALETGLSADSSEADDLSTQINDPNRWLALVDLQLSNGDAKGALSAIDQAEALGAAAADVAVGKAGALIQLKSWSEAQAILEPALEASPNDPRLHNSLGIAYRELGEVDLARQHFERAAVLAPDWDVPQTNLETLPASP